MQFNDILEVLLNFPFIGGVRRYQRKKTLLKFNDIHLTCESEKRIYHLIYRGQQLLIVGQGFADGSSAGASSAAGSSSVARGCASDGASVTGGGTSGAMTRRYAAIAKLRMGPMAKFRMGAMAKFRMGPVAKRGAAESRRGGTTLLGTRST